jgi:hypothetical protein
VKIHYAFYAVGIVATWATCAPLQATTLESTGGSAMPSFAATKPGVSMCAKATNIVFSCPLAHSQKIVSICASDDVEDGKARFYYAYGRPGAPELTYPNDGPSQDGAFTRTHLVFGSNTGGYAYGFTNNGYKYTVYSISGERDLQSGGVIVQRTGSSKALTKMDCQVGRITETNNDAIIDATLRWKSDGAIEASGLPLTH